MSYFGPTKYTTTARISNGIRIGATAARMQARNNPGRLRIIRSNSTAQCYSRIHNEGKAVGHVIPGDSSGRNVAGQDAIGELSPADRQALLAWLIEADRKAWDEEIRRDFSEGGAGMKLVAEIDEQIDCGKFRKLE